MGGDLLIAAGQLERHAGRLLASGLLAAAVFNVWQWRRDVRHIQRLTEEAPPQPANEPAPRVSILLPAWNEANHMAACLDSVRALRYPQLEVVLCAGGEDGTFAIAEAHEAPNVVVLEQLPGEGKQGALQRCFDNSTGEILFLTDADCRLDDDSFERTIWPLVAGAECATTGWRRPLREQESKSLVVFQWVQHIYMELLSPTYIDSLFGINAAVSRSAIVRVDAFNAPAEIGTDLDLARRLTAAGYRIRFVATSHVETEYPETLPAYLRQTSRWYRNRMIIGLRHGSWQDVLATLRAGSAATFMLAVPLAAGFNSRWLFGAWLALMANAMMSQARVIAGARRSGIGKSVPPHRYPAFFACTMAAWLGMARGLVECLIPARRVSW